MYAYLFHRSKFEEGKVFLRVDLSAHNGRTGSGIEVCCHELGVEEVGHFHLRDPKGDATDIETAGLSRQGVVRCVECL